MAWLSGNDVLVWVNYLQTLALLFTILADVFGRNSQASSATDASDIIDLVDFL